jgi:hypothetical protein
MSRTKRLGLVVAAALVSVAAILGFTAGPASATPTFCNGNYLCVNVAGQSVSDLYIHMHANVYSFVGHFQLQTPTGASKNSGDQRWYPGNSGPTFDVPVIYGYYCATAWGKSGSGYTKLGYLCIIAGA